MNRSQNTVFLIGIVFFLSTFQYKGKYSWGISEQNLVRTQRVFAIRIPMEPESFDWHHAHTTIETSLFINLMEGLVQLDTTLEPSSGLAQKWVISKDQKTYTFYLRPQVKWSDGVPLRAQDFVYSWKRLLSRTTASVYSRLLFGVLGAESYYNGENTDFNQVGIRAINDLVLEVKLKEPICNWIFIPGFWPTFPMRQDIIDQYGSNWPTPGRIVTLGPYLFESYDVHSKIILRSNPLYYGSHGNIDEVLIWIEPDDRKALKLYETNQLDLFNNFSHLDTLPSRYKSDLKTFPLFRTEFLGFMVKKYPLSNVEIRRAIAMGIQKKKILPYLSEKQELANSFIPKGMHSYFEKIGLQYSLKNAQLALKNAGIVNPIQLDFFFPDCIKEKNIAQVIQSELKQLDIDLVLKPLDPKNYRTQLDLNTMGLFLLNWTADDFDPGNFLSFFSSQSYQNYTGWQSNAYDKSLHFARQMPMSLEQNKIYFQVQKLLLENEVVILPLYYDSNVVLVKPYVQNLFLNPLGFLYLKNVKTEKQIPKTL